MGYQFLSNFSDSRITNIRIAGDIIEAIPSFLAYGSGGDTYVIQHPHVDNISYIPPTEFSSDLHDMDLYQQVAAVLSSTGDLLPLRELVSDPSSNTENFLTNITYDSSVGWVATLPTGVLQGTLGNDLLVDGSGAADLLLGGGGDDLLMGNDGNDTLDGGAGINSALYHGSPADYSWAQNANGSWTIVGPDGTDLLTHIQFLRFHSGENIALDKSPPPPGTTADMIFHRADGTLEIYNVGNNTILAGYALGQIGINRQFVGLGGFNNANPGQVGNAALGGIADTADIILRDTNSGAFQVYDVSGNNITNVASLGAVGLDWQFGGFGDFSSRPGETDMILRNSSTAALEVYDISNNTIISAYSMGAVGLEWQVAGFGDFSSRANETDMIMRNANTGALEVYNIANNALMSAYSMGAVGLDWQVAGFGHFSSRPNETDMIMRNSNTGALEVYNIANNALMSAYSMGAVGLDWQVVGFGNFRGNANETDMILRNSSTGALELYNIANNALVSAYSAGAIGLDWEVGGIASDALSASSGSSDVNQLVQAMAGFGRSSGAGDDLDPVPFGADTSQQTLLTTPQHA
jgi:hypothetical protein